MLMHGRRVVDTKQCMWLAGDVPYSMSVRGVKVTGYVYGVFFDPPDEVILYASHNGTRTSRVLDAEGIRRNRTCRELGISYVPDEHGQVSVASVDSRQYESQR